MEDKSLTKLSLLSILYFIIPPLIQFLGTEVFKIKIIATLGLNRFSVFNSFIFFVNCLVIFKKSKYFSYCIHFMKKVKIYILEEANDDYESNHFIKRMSKKIKKIFLIFSQAKTGLNTLTLG